MCLGGFRMWLVRFFRCFDLTAGFWISRFHLFFLKVLEVAIRDRCVSDRIGLSLYLNFATLPR